jgi:fucose permease
VRLVLILGCVVTAVAIYGLTISTRYRWAVAAIVLAGLGAACVSTSSVVLMPQAFFAGPADQAAEGYSNKLAAALNLGNAFFALGALVTPALVEVLLRRLSFRRTLGLLAVICLVPAILAAVSTIPGKSHQVNLESLFRDRGLWLAGLVFFLYAPLEASVGAWATTFLTDLGHSERRAVWLLSGFWLAFLASRLGAALLGVQASVWVIFALALLAGVLLGNMASASGHGRLRIEVILLGAALGPIFPTLIALVFLRFPTQPGTAYGAMYAIGSVGSLVLCPVIGLLMRRHTVQQTLRVPMAIALLMGGAALVLGLVW